MAETTGQQLLNARLARGETLDQASQATHIRPRYLQALEMDDWAALPSTVQGKGFLRLYAGYLNLDPQPLLDGLVYRPAPVAEAQSGASSGSPAAAEIRVLPAAAAVLASPGSQAEPVGEDQFEVARPAESVEKPEPLRANSEQIFIEIGQTLKDQRELLSLSLSEVERHTHLRSFTLEALEAGRMEEMPSFVQARGMLANYARFLNLDGEALLLRFAEALQSRREEKITAKLAQKQQAPARRPAPKVVTNLLLKRLFSFDVLAVAGLIVLLVVFIIWGSGQVLSLRAKQGVTPTSPSISDVLLASPQSSQPVAAGVSLTETPSPAAETPTQEQAASPEAPAVQLSLPPGTPGVLEVNLVASQRPWVRVTADGKVVFTGRLDPGSAYPFSGARQVEILTGNAAGFQVFLNNQDLGVPGTEGQVLNLVFTDKGMVKATIAAPTSQAAGTKSPSGTGTAGPAGSPKTTQTPPPPTPVR